MRQNYLSITAFLISVLILFSTVQKTSCQSMPEARNTIYFSIGLLPSVFSICLNYERMISPNSSIKTGINLCIGYSNADVGINDYYLSFPFTANYLTSGNNKFEFGAGAGPIFRLSGIKRKIFPIMPAGSIGYRYQLESKSMFLKAGLELPAAPMLNFGGIGYHF
jgi:hypothetical protein